MAEEVKAQEEIRIKVRPVMEFPVKDGVPQIDVALNGKYQMMICQDGNRQVCKVIKEE